MKHVLLCAITIAVAWPAAAQRRVDLIVDAEGVHRANRVVFEPNVVRYEPRFDNGGGIGGGIDWFVSDRVSLEVKVAGLASQLHVRRAGSDFVTIANLGYAQIYPITALVQWHMFERGAIRPYLGVGAGHVILRNIDRSSGSLSGVRFKDPTGLVVDGGLELSLSRRFSIVGDARYTPIETHARAAFSGTSSDAQIAVKPLVVATGIAFHF
jgi:outer membrane protein W